MDREEMEARADARLETALAEHALRDPRGFYRKRLRALKEHAPSAFERALRYYEDELVPRVADEVGDALAEWAEYGLLLAELSGPGRTVAVDPSGRARPYEAPLRADCLVLHLPDEERVPALVISLPREPSPPQRATYELLVS